MWTGAESEILFYFQYFLRSTVVLPRKYWSTPYAVLEYFFGSTGKRLSAEIGDLQESCLNAERTDSICRGDSPFLYLKSCCLIE